MDRWILRPVRVSTLRKFEEIRRLILAGKVEELEGIRQLATHACDLADEAIDGPIPLPGVAIHPEGDDDPVSIH